MYSQHSFTPGNIRVIFEVIFTFALFDFYQAMIIK